MRAARNPKTAIPLRSTVGAIELEAIDVLKAKGQRTGAALYTVASGSESDGGINSSSAAEGDRRMKSPFLASTLSFFLVGSGLWYLGWRRWAVANLLVVLAIGITAALAFPEDVFDRNIGLLGATCGGGSDGLAMVLAQQRNQRAEAQRHAEPL